MFEDTGWWLVIIALASILEGAGSAYFTNWLEVRQAERGQEDEEDDEDCAEEVEDPSEVIRAAEKRLSRKIGKLGEDIREEIQAEFARMKKE